MLDSCLISEEDMPGYQNTFSQREDPFNGLWNDAIHFFKESLFDNDDEWEEV